MPPPPIVGWWPPYPYLADDPPYPYLADDPPTHTWLMTPPTHTWLMTPLPILGWWPPPPNGWMMCWVKLVLVLYVWRQDRMRPAQQGLPFISQVPKTFTTWYKTWQVGFLGRQSVFFVAHTRLILSGQKHNLCLQHDCVPNNSKQLYLEHKSCQTICKPHSICVQSRFSR